MLHRRAARSVAAVFFGVFLLHFNSAAQDRISGAVDDHRTVTLTGNRHPLARASSTPGQLRPISAWTA